MKETKFGSGSGFIREETNSNIVCDVYLFGSFYLFVCLLRFSYKYQIFLNAKPFTLVGRHGIMVFLLKTSRGTEFLPLIGTTSIGPSLSFEGSLQDY